MKKKIEAVIFDFDGVIADTGEDLANAVLYTLESFSRPVLSREEIIGYVGDGAETLIRRCFKECDEDTVLKALPVYKQYYLENAVLKTRLYEGVKETLEQLKDKKLALVTNKPEAQTLKIIEALGVKHYFRQVIAPERLKHMKPHPEGILKALEAFGEPAGNAVMVGDSYTDIEAGKSAGTYTCGVTYGLGNVEKLREAEPDFVVSNLRHLLDYIE